MSKDRRILVLGAGDFATGVIRRLFIAGFDVVATELERPLTVRRLVAFSEAVYRERHAVEGVTAVLSSFDRWEEHLADGLVPVVVDPRGRLRETRAFGAIVDARMAKRNLDTKVTDAPIVIGLGPGFEAGVDCHAAIETLRGENLGRVIRSGRPAPNTGLPDAVDLELLRAPCCACSPSDAPCSADDRIEDLVLFARRDGLFRTEREIASLVRKDDILGSIAGEQITAGAEGALRGLLHDGLEIRKGTKLVEIDPTGDPSRCFRISAKANAIAGGVLEAVFALRGSIPPGRSADAHGQRSRSLSE
ncbi:MAG: selenium-dependent molybdenum cofactor biosynthesis protein YqeB [Planctomycetota bacterium]|nr:selenium-dependent molybdenum cofactor biosynthesis protein YqeB [Planctomycetota bacterium]